METVTFLDRTRTITFAVCRAHMTDDEDSADILFTTAHKAKGLEFDTVKVVDDFRITPDLEKGSDDEKNLLYVAVSRYMNFGQ